MGVLDDLAEAAWQVAEAHGWHAPRDIEGVVRNASATERLCLIHSEVSEAMEEVRADRWETWYDKNKGGKPEGLPIELADILIRVGDMAREYKEKMGMGLDEAVEIKAAFNETRPFRHGGKLI